MKTLIEEVNEKLSYILSSLESRKFELEDSLADVQDKIDDKIEEAKGYKTDVDAAKKEIKNYEDEIASLENDLNDLTARFSNKDLNAILETGNKEINNQIMLKQKEIAKQREKIAEYTEKARMIKDLLISLKKDKEIKKSKLADLNEVHEYYDKELNKIMTFAIEHPDDLVVNAEEEKEIEPSFESYEFKNEPIVDDKPIFDAIESIENDEDNVQIESDESAESEHITDVEEPTTINEDENEVIEEKNDEVIEAVEEENNTVNTIEDREDINPFEVANVDEPTFENNNIFNDTTNEEVSNSNDNELNFNNPIEPIKEDTTKEEVNEEENTSAINLLNEFNLFTEDELTTEPIHEEDLYKDESNNIVNLFDHDSNDSFDSFDFKALSDSIDREYENIFGNSEEIKLNDEDDIFSNRLNNNLDENTISNENDFNKDFDFFGNTEPVENILNEVHTDENKEIASSVDNTEVINFFKNNNIDFDKFSKEEQEDLVKNFNLVSYTKTLDILRKNNIKLDLIYGAADVFKMVHSELEGIISKLLLAGQSTLNISYILNSLPYIKTIDLQDVIDSYGNSIKDANITDLVIKAKHLSELGGGNN